MSTEDNISFDENKYKIKSRVIFGQSEVPKMITFLTTKGIVKNEKQAKMVLLGITACFFIASIVVFAVFVLDVKVGEGQNQPTSEEMQASRDRFEQAAKEYNNTNTQTNQ